MEGWGVQRGFALFSGPVFLSLTLGEVCDSEVRIKPLIWKGMGKPVWGQKH